MSMPAGATASTQVPYVNAEVEEVDAASGLVTLKHEAIPNVNMPGMTMPFPVADPKLLEGLHPGDKVRVKVDQIHGALTLTAVERGK
jgi:Cu/Ag efflux protein CusF